MDDDARARRPIMTRRRLEVTIGLLWLLDGTLQAQPYMFTSTFFSNNFGMANMGLPLLAARVEGSLDTAFGAHPAPWNAVFAIVQLSLGAGLLWPRTAKVALGASVGWGIAVWLIGEGIGGRLYGNQRLLGNLERRCCTPLPQSGSGRHDQTLLRGPQWQTAACSGAGSRSACGRCCGSERPCSSGRASITRRAYRARNWPISVRANRGPLRASIIWSGI